MTDTPEKLLQREGLRWLFGVFKNDSAGDPHLPTY